MEFIRRGAPGLALSLLLIGLLTYLLILWGRRQAKQILESEEHATLAARTDALTGLPNRVALREAFTRQLDVARRRGETLGALSIDLDQFKAINDAFGAGIGDAVLVAAARRLRAILPHGGFLARIDGDTFVMLVPHLDEAKLAELAADAMATIAEPFDLAGTRVFVTASIGYAIGPRDGGFGR